MLHRPGNFTLITALSLITLYASQCSSKVNEGKASQTNDTVATTATPQATPTYRVLYHGVHPGSATGDETTIDDLGIYEDAMGQKAAFIYFTQELNEAWLNGTDTTGPPVFPGKQVDDI